MSRDLTHRLSVLYPRMAEDWSVLERTHRWFLSVSVLAVGGLSMVSILSSATAWSASFLIGGTAIGFVAGFMHVRYRRLERRLRELVET